ncbi:MAG: phosphate acetyltransferase [Sinobacterium sp.]|nr:phosphate acetyltransferase [Sinobacterium sp.]
MSKVFLLVPASRGTGVTTVSLGLQYLFDQRGVNAKFFWPSGKPNHSMEALTGVSPVLCRDALKTRLASHQIDDLLEELVAAFEVQTEGAEIIVVLGVAEGMDIPQASAFNAALAKSLDAQIILVASATEPTHAALNQRLNMVSESLGSARDRLVGVIINKVGVPLDQARRIRPDVQSPIAHNFFALEEMEKPLAFCRNGISMLGCIPWDKNINRPRTKDMEKICDIQYLAKGDADQRRISWLTIATRTVGALAESLKANTLLITGGDRDDVLIMAALAELNGIELAGILLSSGSLPSPATMQLIAPAIEKGLPILVAQQNTYDVVSNISDLYTAIPDDDEERFLAVSNHIANHLNREALRELATVTTQRCLSPAAFRYGLVKRARQVNQCIALPEGEEPRTIQAAQICAERGIARSILIGQPKNILAQAKALDIELHKNISILEPETIYEKYVEPLVELRKHKGMNAALAKETLLDNTIMLGTMMLQQGDVDGLVAGALSTTAETIQPALQLIKTRPGQSLVSSCFFMCLPDQVLVYADCAVNPDPNAEQLADIAIQSANSAEIFGIDPRIAMISYSTGKSGMGADVDKVREATQLAVAKRADLLIDGPLQYDAASVASVAASKAPNSKVAGKATVFIFPDLNTGNTTYKAVQRSAGVISIGPMLQGLNKPVNDLSRGALVDDIVYTIALTAIQASDK